MNNEIYEKISRVLSKLTIEERKCLSRLIACESNYYIMNYLKPQSNARVESVADFTMYLQEKFDLMDHNQRMHDAVNSLSSYEAKECKKAARSLYLKRIK